MTGPQRVAALQAHYEADRTSVQRLIAAGDAVGLGHLLMNERATRYARETRELRARIAGGRSATVSDERLRDLVQRIFRYRPSELRAMQLQELAQLLRQADSECRELSAN